MRRNVEDTVIARHCRIDVIVILTKAEDTLTFREAVGSHVPFPCAALHEVMRPELQSKSFRCAAFSTISNHALKLIVSLSLYQSLSRRFQITFQSIRFRIIDNYRPPRPSGRSLDLPVCVFDNLV